MADDKSRDESEKSGDADKSANSAASSRSEKSESKSGKGAASGKSDRSKATKTASKTKAQAPSEQRTGPVTFYRQVVAELRKVVWPTREQLVTYFFVVMAFVLVMIAIVTLLDLGFGKLVFAVFGGADNV